MALTREQILSAGDIRTETVQVSEWGGPVIVRGLTAKERDAFEETWFETIDRGAAGESSVRRMENLRARLLVRCLVDEQGKLLFGESDADALGGKSAKAVHRLFTVARRLSGMSTADVDTLTKNSVGGQPDDSPSVSLVASA